MNTHGRVWPDDAEIVPVHPPPASSAGEHAGFASADTGFEFFILIRSENDDDDTKQRAGTHNERAHDE